MKKCFTWYGRPIHDFGKWEKLDSGKTEGFVNGKLVSLSHHLIQKRVCSECGYIETDKQDIKLI